MRQRHVEQIAVVVGFGLLTTAPQAAELPRPAAPEATTGRLEEIVVTATRREERLLDIPQAVTALSSDALTAGGVQTFADYGRLVPGLAFADFGTGRPKPSLRGINVNTGAATVGFYIDEAPIPTSSGSIRLTTVDPRLVDVDRIEVLRGPQGTLFGAGSMGGAIRIITKLPDPQAFGGQVRVSAQSIASGGPGGGVDGVLNLPILDERVAARISGWAHNADGFIAKTVNGTKVRDVPDERTRGGRLQIGAAHGRIRADASVLHQEQRFNGFQTITAGPGNPGNSLVQNLLFDVPEPNVNRFTLANLTLQVDLDPATLISSSSYYKGGLVATEEGSQFLADFIGPSVPTAMTERSIRIARTQELRLTSKRPLFGFDYTVGGFFEYQQLFRDFDWVDAAYASVVGDPDLFVGRYRSPLKQRAIFGELSFRPVPSVTLTAGGRYYRLRGHDDQYSAGVFNGGVTVDRLSYKDNGTVGKFVASWKPSENTQLYAQAAQGYRPGFGVAGLPVACNADLLARGLPVGATQVDADQAWNYEIGAKGARADGRANAALAIYQIDWRDVQLAVFLPCGFRVASNAGDARVRGVEFESAFRPRESLEIGGSASWTDTEFRRVLAGAGPSRGDAVLEVPKWQAAVYVQQSFPLAGAFAGTVRVDAQHSGRSLLFYDRTAVTAPAPLSFRERPTVTLINVRLEAESNDWTIALYGRNLTNQVRVVGFADSLSANLQNRPRLSVNVPRTVGAEVTRRF